MTDVSTNEVLMQLFVDGPTWDGNLISKYDRDQLVEKGLCDRHNGWNFLTLKGVIFAVDSGKRARSWMDQRWYKKATNQ